MAQTERRGGRQKAESLSKFINFRARPSLHAAVTEAAKREGRSISEEVELRLQRSLDSDTLMADVFGHVAHRPLVLALCSAIRAVELADNSDGDVVQAYAAVIATVRGLAGDMTLAEIMARAETASGYAAVDVAGDVVAVATGKPKRPRTPLLERNRG